MRKGVKNFTENNIAAHQSKKESILKKLGESVRKFLPSLRNNGGGKFKKVSLKKILKRNRRTKRRTKRRTNCRTKRWTQRRNQNS